MARSAAVIKINMAEVRGLVHPLRLGKSACLCVRLVCAPPQALRWLVYAGSEPFLVAALNAFREETGFEVRCRQMVMVHAAAHVRRVGMRACCLGTEVPAACWERQGKSSANLSLMCCAGAWLSSGNQLLPPLPRRCRRKALPSIVSLRRFNLLKARRLPRTMTAGKAPTVPRAPFSRHADNVSSNGCGAPVCIDGSCRMADGSALVELAINSDVVELLDEYVENDTGLQWSDVVP
eukprot:352483-Chlamydomonas_euryale.AAC.8